MMRCVVEKCLVKLLSRCVAGERNMARRRSRQLAGSRSGGFFQSDDEPATNKPQGSLR